MLAMFPHMHLRGKAFRYTAIYPDGKQEILLDVPRYDFNWQNSYEFAEPKLMPAGHAAVLRGLVRQFGGEPGQSRSDRHRPLGRPDLGRDDDRLFRRHAGRPGPDDGRRAAARGRPSSWRWRRKARRSSTDELKALAATVARIATRTSIASARELRKIAPQLDRLCWTTVEDGKLHIRRCVQEPELREASRRQRAARSMCA